MYKRGKSEKRKFILYIWNIKKNGNNFSILKKYNAKFIGEVITKNKYPMFKLQEYFPYLQNNKNQAAKKRDETLCGQLCKFWAYNISDQNYKYILIFHFNNSKIYLKFYLINKSVALL